MDKKICFAVVCALAVVYGCDDDAGLGSKVVETCTRPGETKCTTEGARVVCQDGVYVPSACESNEACVAGECVRRCDVATFPKDCDGNVSVTCGPDGYVVRKPCDGTCVGGDCRSTQSGGNVGNSFDFPSTEHDLKPALHVVPHAPSTQTSDSGHGVGTITLSMQSKRSPPALQTAKSPVQARLHCFPVHTMSLSHGSRVSTPSRHTI